MAPRTLTIVFFGTADFAVPSLEALIASGHNIAAVVTQPDKPHGRGRGLDASAVKKAAERHGLTVLQPRRVRSEAFIEQIRGMAPDLLALAAYGQLMPQSLLDIPPLGPINVHGSLLPRYRGAAPIQRAIIQGEAITGVTTMWMDSTLDTGDILLSASELIEPTDTSASLTPRLANRGARLLLETIEGLAEGTLIRRPQNHSLATLAPALKPEDGYVDWTDGAVSLSCRIRGVNPKPGAFAAIRGRRFKIWGAVADATTEDTTHDAEPGTILALAKNPPGVLVSAGSGTAIRLLEVQPESGKRMAAADWARGLHIESGERLTSLS